MDNRSELNNKKTDINKTPATDMYEIAAAFADFVARADANAEQKNNPAENK